MLYQLKQPTLADKIIDKAKKKVVEKDEKFVKVDKLKVSGGGRTASKKSKKETKKYGKKN